MKIHEYQAKELFKKYGVPVPEGAVAFRPDEAAAVALLLMCLKYFGIDLPNIFRKDKPSDKTIEMD